MNNVMNIFKLVVQLTRCWHTEGRTCFTRLHIYCLKRISNIYQEANHKLYANEAQRSSCLALWSNYNLRKIRLESHACAESVECVRSRQKCWLAGEPYARLTESFKAEMVHESMACLQSCSGCRPSPTELHSPVSRCFLTAKSGLANPARGRGKAVYFKRTRTQRKQ